MINIASTQVENSKPKSMFDIRINFSDDYAEIVNELYQFLIPKLDEKRKKDKEQQDKETAKVFEQFQKDYE